MIYFLNSFSTWVKNFFLSYFTATKYKMHLFSFSGFYFCDKTDTISVILRILNTRKAFSIPLNELIKCKVITKNMHPIYSFYLGSLAGLIDHSALDIKRFTGIKMAVEIKSISNAFDVQKNLVLDRVICQEKSFVLKSKMHKNFFHIKAIDIVKNKFILSCVEQEDAFFIGYNILEFSFLDEEISEHFSWT